MPKSVFSDGYKVLLHALIKARKDRGINQAELARRLQRPQSFISKIERGERRLDLIETVIVARALGLDEAEFIASIVRHLPPDMTIPAVGRKAQARKSRPRVEAD